MKKPEAVEMELEQALSNFRQNVHAWSEAELSRPRAVTVERARSWRLAAAWALGCVLAAGSLGGDLYDRHLHQVEARIAAERQAQQMAEAQRAQAAARQNDEKLFAAVDRDVSRAVPSAMEPLAQLMDDSSSQ